MDISDLDNTMAQMLMETVNNMLIELYAAMAQAEMEKKEKRQREGIQAKKARGEWDDYGRLLRITLDLVVRVECFVAGAGSLLLATFSLIAIMNRMWLQLGIFAFLGVLTWIVILVSAQLLCSIEMVQETLGFRNVEKL